MENEEVKSKIPDRVRQPLKVRGLTKAVHLAHLMHACDSLSTHSAFVLICVDLGSKVEFEFSLPSESVYGTFFYVRRVCNAIKQY